jgi:hypothetical protein
MDRKANQNALKEKAYQTLLKINGDAQNEIEDYKQQRKNR